VYNIYVNCIYMKGGNFMPFLDGTGPRGLGPMTGRGLGRCSGFYGRGYGYGARGFGRGFGYGRGYGYGPRAYGGWAGAYYPPSYPVGSDKAFLESQREYLKNELNYIEGILKETDDSQKKDE
jgi:hypothetical protein